MNREEALRVLKQGRVKDWNAFRERHPDWIPDLTGESLWGDGAKRLNLAGLNLSGAKLSGTFLYMTELVRSDMRQADLRGAYLRFSDDRGGWKEADLMDADLRGANLRGAKMPHQLDRYRLSTRQVTMDGATYDGFTDSGKVDLSEFGAVFESVSTELKAEAPASIFISYAWANKQVILGIDQWLRNKGLTTKMDHRDFFAGSRIMEEISRVMLECNVILIFTQPSRRTSRGRNSSESLR